MLLKCIESLSPESDAVYKEKDSLDTSCSHESIDKSDACAGLPGASSHYKKKLSPFLGYTFHNRANGLKLIIASCYGCVNQLLGERLLMFPYVKKAF